MPTKNDQKSAATKASSAAQASATAEAWATGAAATRRARELSRPQLESLREKLRREYHGSR